MVRDLITLPLRVGAAATGLASQLAERAVMVGVTATERLIGLALDQITPDPPAPPAPPEARTTPPVRSAPAPAPAPAPPPAHVSREPELVDASADPGAEQGPGATVRIDEPWAGYRQMTAPDVIDRLTGASAEELAAAALYERAHRGRKTVLAAADRELRRQTADRRG
jgi:hypothetical protein